MDIFYGVDWEFVFGACSIIYIVFFIFIISITRLKEHYVKAEQINKKVEQKEKIKKKENKNELNELNNGNFNITYEV